MDVYGLIGGKRVINCYDTYTMLGGPIIPPEVRRAMDEANRYHAWIWELEEKAGRRIAELTGAEAAFVTPGAFAGLAMAAAACIAGDDPEKMRRLPDTTGMRNEIIIQRPLRDFQYDRSMTVAGGRLVEVGDLERGCTQEQIEAAISDRTAAIHYMAHGPSEELPPGCRYVPLEEVIEIGHSHGIPIIVDAAFQCYPIEEFRRYVAMGADLVAYSCKYFGGPNTAGIMLGRADLIRAVAHHSFIGQEGAERGRELPSTRERGYYSSVFRGYKLDRASIIGAVAALEWYMKRDHEKALREAYRRCEWLMSALKGIPDIEMEVIDRRMKGVDPLRVALQITLKNRTEEDGRKMVRELMSGDPEIWLESRGNSLIVGITSFRGLMLFHEEDLEIIADRLRSVLT